MYCSDDRLCTKQCLHILILTFVEKNPNPFLSVCKKQNFNLFFFFFLLELCTSSLFIVLRSDLPTNKTCSPLAIHCNLTTYHGLGILFSNVVFPLKLQTSHSLPSPPPPASGWRGELEEQKVKGTG